MGKIAPNLLQRDFYAEKLNQKWITDVAEFDLFGQKLYLFALLDLYSSYPTSYTILERPVLSNAAVMENFFGLLKSELFYLQEFQSMEHFKGELGDWWNIWIIIITIESKLKGLPPAIHRQQALLAF